MNLYGRCFKWILKRINLRLKGAPDHFSSVGVLDIFGFENFSVRWHTRYFRIGVGSLGKSYNCHLQNPGAFHIDTKIELFCKYTVDLTDLCIFGKDN